MLIRKVKTPTHLQQKVRIRDLKLNTMKQVIKEIKLAAIAMRVGKVFWKKNSFKILKIKINVLLFFLGWPLKLVLLQKGNTEHTESALV